MEGGNIKYHEHARVFYIENVSLSKKSSIALEYNRLEVDLFNLLELICTRNHVPLVIGTRKGGYVDTHAVYAENDVWWDNVYSFMSSGQKKLFIYLLETNIKKRVEDFLVNYKDYPIESSEPHFNPVRVRNEFLNKFSEPVDNEQIRQFYESHTVPFSEIANPGMLTSAETLRKINYSSERAVFDEIVGLHNFMIKKGVKYDEIQRNETSFFIKYFRDYYNDDELVDTYSIYCNTTIITKVVLKLTSAEKRLFLTDLVKLTHKKIQHALTHPGPMNIMEVKNIALHVEVRTNVIDMFLNEHHVDMSVIQGASLIEQYEMTEGPTHDHLPGLSITPLTIPQQMLKEELKLSVLKDKPKSLGAESRPFSLFSEDPNDIPEKLEEPEKEPEKEPEVKVPKKTKTSKNKKMLKEEELEYLQQQIELVKQELAKQELAKSTGPMTRSRTKNGKRKTRRLKRRLF